MTRLAAIFSEYLINLSYQDDRLWVLDGDLADSYGIEKFAALRPDRFIMAGIAEQNMISMAAGMASCGARPWVFSFAAFLVYRGADQIRVSLAQTKLPVTLVGSHAGGCGDKNGKTHQAISDMNMISSLGTVDVWSPCDEADAHYIMAAVLRNPGPAYIRCSRENIYSLPGKPGDIRLLTAYSENIILSTGLSSSWALEIHQKLLTQNYPVCVIHLSRVYPIVETILTYIKQVKHWFVIEDHIYQGGLASHLVDAAKLLPDAWFDWQVNWCGGSGCSLDLRRSGNLDSDFIVNAIKNYLTEKDIDNAL